MDDTLDLLSSHIAQQNARLIEARDKLNAFTESVSVATTRAEELFALYDERTEVLHRQLQDSHAKATGMAVSAISLVVDRAMVDLAEAIHLERKEAQEEKAAARAILIEAQAVGRWSWKNAVAAAGFVLLGVLVGAGLTVLLWAK